jgi:hypothetical protein
MENKSTSYSSGRIALALIIVVIIAVLAGLGSWYIWLNPSSVSTLEKAISPTEMPSPLSDEKNTITAEGELVEKFPDFPVFPGAAIHESSARIETRDTGRDLRAEWTVKSPVIDVMQWYIAELPKQGWTVEPPNDPVAEGEQIAHISKGTLSGYIAVEDEGEQITEIVVDLKNSSSSL